MNATSPVSSDLAARIHHNRWRVLALVGLVQLIVVLDVTIVNIALPSAQKALGFSTADRQWIVTAYALAFGSLLLVGGRASDMLGRKWTLLGGLCGFVLASALGGSAPSFAVLVFARAIQGMFGAFMAPAALSTLSTTFDDDDERRVAFAVYGGIAGAGGAIGLLLGGVLTQYLSWRFCLYVNLLLAVPALIAGFALLTNVPGEGDKGLDVAGALLSCAGLFALVFGLNRAETDGWGAGITVGFLIAAAVLLIVFVVRETRVAQPLLPMRVVIDRNRGGAYLAVLSAGIVLFGVFLFLTYYLQETLRMSPTTAGLAFLPMVVTLMVTAMVAQTQLLPRLGPKPLIATGLAIGAGGLALLAQLKVTSTYAADVLPGLLVAGVAMGLVMATAMGTATRGVTEADAGVASAMVNTSQQIGGSIGTALLSTIASTAAANFVVGKAPSQLLAAQAAVHGYTTAFWAGAAVFAGAAIICGLLLRPGKPAPLAAGATPAAV